MKVTFNTRVPEEKNLRPGRDVLLKLLDDVILLGEGEVQQIVRGNDPKHFARFGDGNVAHAMLAHDGHAFIKARLRTHSHRIAGHDFGNAGLLGRKFLEHRTAGAMALEADKPLAILPAGTMNLYARALKIPLDLDVAVSALAAGDLGKSDIGRANGRPFLHQFSIGFHSRMVAERNSYNFASKLGKIRASIVAAIDTIRRPPSFPIEMNIDGREVSERISSLAVSNNPYGEGHLPYADAVTSGKLGIYYARPSTAAANARMLADLTIGNVQNNPDIVQESGTRVRLSFPQKRKSAKAVIDGELVDLDPSVDIEILPGALKVILPARDKAE